MNKAFMREPDDSGQRHCPRCQSLGIAVHQETLAAQLRPAALQQLASDGFFCPYATCEVSYFDVFERCVTTEALQRPVYPKDPDAPICGCFGMTTDDIDADLREGSPRRVRELVAKAKSPAARCTTCSPTGQSCVGAIQKYFMQRKEGSG